MANDRLNIFVLLAIAFFIIFVVAPVIGGICQAICPPPKKKELTPEEERLALENTKKERRSKQEELVKKILEEHLNKIFITIRPAWLKGYKGRNLEIDLWNESLNLGVEVQGEQHFDKNGFNMGGEKFSQQYANDIRKVELCAKHGITLIHVLYFQDTKESIIKQLYTELTRKGRQELARNFILS